ncbi:uncharacterized protein BP01DRAFT_275562, partial [Aspergillus saccharolyticus JOP 1030-1]
YTLFLCYLYLAGTIFFDWIHFLLHRWSRSQWRILRQLSRYHQYHHLYYGRLLQFNPKYSRRNARIALPFELFCQMLGTVVGWLLARVVAMSIDARIDRRGVLLVLLTQLARVWAVILHGGKDSNHVSYETIPKDRNWTFVGPEYHALHHHDPDKYMGSAVKLFDWVAGTAYSLRGKVVMAGDAGDLGPALEKQLLSEGVKAIHNLDNNLPKNSPQRDLMLLKPMLDDADILILAHINPAEAGDEESDCTSTVRLIQHFLTPKAMRRRKVLPEVWYLAGTTELSLVGGDVFTQQDCKPAQSSFLPYARSLYKCSQVTYRHILLPASGAFGGRRNGSSDWIAGTALWWIRRGAQFIPVTCSPSVLLQFLDLLL